MLTANSSRRRWNHLGSGGAGLRLAKLIQQSRPFPTLGDQRLGVRPCPVGAAEPEPCLGRDQTVCSADGAFRVQLEQPNGLLPHGGLRR